jgi:hypothetical protein
VVKFLTMQALIAVSLAAALMTPMTLQVEVERERGALKIHFDLADGLPASFEEALPSGANVRVTYQVRVRANEDCGGTGASGAEPRSPPWPSIR